MITINKSKCIKCYACVRTCPFIALTRGTDGDVEFDESKCINCMHCAAVCEQHAVMYEGRNAYLGEVAELGEGFAKELKQHILQRRSYRHFKPEPVNRELIKEALELASWAPSAKNQKSTEWIVIDNRDIIEGMKKAFMDFARENKDPILIPCFDAGKNPVMGNASTLILAYARDNDISPETDTAIAMASAELYLQARGIGTCWGGYLKRMSGSVPGAASLLPALPKGYSYYGAFFLGYPDENYVNVPLRHKQAKITWV